MRYRQGDILIERVAELPEGCVAVPRDDGRLILAYGEATGHAHAMVGSAELYETEEGQRFLQVLAEGGVLTHEEHGPIVLPPGTYRVGRQREYAPRNANVVRD